jgi:hypothetical protein
MHRIVLGLAGLVAAIVVSPACASQIVSTSTVSNVTLGVNAQGEAMVSYTAGGKSVHVLAQGAINAIPPTRGGTQVAFTFSYDGGYQKQYTDNPTVIATLTSLRALQTESRKLLAASNKKQSYALGPKIAADYAMLDKLRSAATDYWETFSCPTYDGPALADVVAACKAPDGSYWAVQSWDRDLPDYGVAPTVTQTQMEVHLSHWTGALPQLTVHTDWAWGGQWNHLWGTFTYNGQGVYGFSSTPGGVPLDTFGRNLYVDTYGSKYGPGWMRENSFLTHDPAGSFCYSFNPHGSHPAGNGSQYRLTIMGPGVTPDVSVTVPAPGAYSKTGQAADNAALTALDDPLCQVHV